MDNTQIFFHFLEWLHNLDCKKAELRQIISIFLSSSVQDGCLADWHNKNYWLIYTYDVSVKIIQGSQMREEMEEQQEDPKDP
jgi:hypothetical protein